MPNGYTLVICEKPDAARRVSAALSGGPATSAMVDGTTVFRFTRAGGEYVVCSAQGHVYGISDPLGERTVYPVFDAEWYPSDLVDERSKGASRRISAIRKLAEGAARFVNACDFDVEGETIGYNLLKYACGGKEKTALRARFSTLTEEDLGRAFGELDAEPEQDYARAGRARHLIDFVWGVNLSRALSQATLETGGRYRTVSMGRVQGPTLEFLVRREREIRSFVPVPYWRASGTFEKDGERVEAGYAIERIQTQEMAQAVRKDCFKRETVASAVRRRLTLVGPPAPFNIGDLQKEAYAAFHFAPSRTLRVAERLYLDALISYPRTGSQRLPPSIGYRRIIQGLGRMPEYAPYAQEVLHTDPKPVQGSKSDPAHPAIHPTGERPRRRLEASEASVFDLIARRFLASFGQSAKKEAADVVLSVGTHEFKASGETTVYPGWMKCYAKYVKRRDVSLPKVVQGDRFSCVDVLVASKSSQRPPRFTQSSLLEKMEDEGIGTKATRADIIATLVGRGYASGETMEVSELGFSVAETMEEYAPSITSTKLTKDIEQRLEAVEEGRGGEKELLRETVRSIANQVERLGANEDSVGRAVGSNLSGAHSSVLGACPVCKSGELRVVRSRTTRKRFVGCSNYASGCRASAPLPQKGTVVATRKACERCSWPVVIVRGWGRPWKLCTNSRCPGKRKR